MTRSLILIAGILLPMLVANAQVNVLPPAPHLLVRGHAEGRYVPDRFTIRLEVEVTDMSPDLARSKVERHMQQLLKALQSSGALRDRTQATVLAIEPDTEYHDQNQVFAGTKVSRSITATFDDVNKLRAFIAQVPADKEVQIQKVDVNRSDISKIELELRRAAIADSQESAKQIATAYGLSIKGIYSVSEVAPEFSYGIQTLQTVVVTGSTYHPDAAMRVGTMDEKQDIYVVYLTESAQ